MEPNRFMMWLASVLVVMGSGSVFVWVLSVVAGQSNGWVMGMLIGFFILIGLLFGQLVPEKSEKHTVQSAMKNSLQDMRDLHSLSERLRTLEREARINSIEKTAVPTAETHETPGAMKYEGNEDQ